MKRISPEVILLRPPEKLVIEMKSSGRFARIDWQKNGVLITKTPEEFPNHNEIFVREPTSMDDLTLYEVSLFPASLGVQFALPAELDFIVTSPGRSLVTVSIDGINIVINNTVDASTTANNGSLVRVVEGESVTISCTSTGAPVPTITWTFNTQPVQIIPTKVVTESQAMLVRTNPNDFISDIVVGNIMSSISIVNAQYPEDDGEYTCIGTNDIQMMNCSSAMITVQVVGK